MTPYFLYRDTQTDGITLISGISQVYLLRNLLVIETLNWDFL